MNIGNDFDASGLILEHLKRMTMNDKTSIMKRITQKWRLLPMLFLGVIVFYSCEEETPGDEMEAPVASFQADISESNYLAVQFTNFSQNAVAYAWDFGDNVGVSVDEDPLYTYTEEGIYEVTLVAANEAGETHTFSETIEIENPDQAAALLLGEWRLLADASTGVNTFQVGPSSRSEIWWSYGTAEQLCVRECVLDDTWTFNEDGTYDFDNHGDFWADAGIFAAEIENTCFDATVADNWIGVNNQDLSGWDSGTHNYVYDANASTLTVQGGFIGLAKAGTDNEYTEPQASVTYQVVKLVDSDVDTLVLETVLTDASGYWSFTLVKYGNPNDAVEVGPCETAGVISDVNIDFETDAPTWTAFGGTDSNGAGVMISTEANPVSGGINTSAMVGQLVEADGSQGWTGISTVLDGVIDFSTKRTFKMKVYSPFVGATVKFKLESSINSSDNKEIDVPTTVANEWEELTFEFLEEDTERWDVLVLFFDFQADVKSVERTHYFDDIILE